MAAAVFWGFKVELSRIVRDRRLHISIIPMIAATATTTIPMVAMVAFLCSSVVRITITIPKIAATATITTPAVGDRVGDGSDGCSVRDSGTCSGVGATSSTGVPATDTIAGDDAGI